MLISLLLPLIRSGVYTAKACVTYGGRYVRVTAAVLCPRESPARSTLGFIAELGRDVGILCTPESKPPKTGTRPNVIRCGSLGYV